MTQNLRVQELDFDTIKENLKEFMRSKPEFSDYDFEGSGISALLNILAYNTHYTAVLANMQMNELFLDTATKRTTAALHASRLGYVPGSIKSPVAKVNLEVFTGSNMPDTLTIGKGAIFNTTVSGTTFQYVTTEARTVARSSTGRYLFDNLEIREGTLRLFRYQYQVNNPIRFTIPSKFADITTLKVKVQASSTNTSTFVYVLNKSIVESSRDSQVYYLKLNQAGFYEVRFGDGIVSKAIEDGNIVILEYLETNGNISNGASQFIFADNVQGYSSNLVTTVMSSYGGDAEQTADEIKVSAAAIPFTQNRAVTESDYIASIMDVYPAESISVWGGERNDPPVYGRVFISVKPTGGGYLTQSTKRYIESELVKKKNVLTVTPIFVDPDYTYLEIDSVVYYNSETIDYGSSTLETFVKNKISEFAADNLGKFSNSMRYTKLCNAIDSVSPAIYSNITKLQLKKHIISELLRSYPQTIWFGNPLVQGTISSDAFEATNTDQPMYIEDVDGILRLFYRDGPAKKVISENAGTVDYSTGKIVMSPVVVTSQTDIVIRATPASNDIFSSRQNILMLDPVDITVDAIRDTLDSGTRIFTASR